MFLVISLMDNLDGKQKVIKILRAWIIDKQYHQAGIRYPDEEVFQYQQGYIRCLCDLMELLLEL